MNEALAHDLPFWEFEQTPFPHLILNDGSLSSAMELTPMDIECFDEARINALTVSLRNFVNTLTEGITAQIYVKVESDFNDVIERHLNLVKTDIRFLRDLDQDRIARTRSQAEGGHVFRPKVFLILKTEEAKKPKAFSLRALEKFSSEFAKSYDNLLQGLSQAIQGSQSALGSIGFDSRLLERDESISILYQYLNPTHKSLTEPPRVGKSIDLDGGSPREQIVFGDLILAEENFILDSKLTRVLSLKTLPEMTVAGQMAAFLALDFKFELLFSFHIPDQTKEMKALEQKRRMAHSLASTSAQKVSDLESESRLVQTTDLIREIIDTGQKIFQVEMLVILRAEKSLDGHRTLNLQTKRVLAQFKSLSGADGIHETVGAWKIFKSDLPLAPQSLVRAKRMKTNNLVDFLPLYGAGSGDDKPLVLTNAKSGSLFSLNPYDSKLTNYNSLVTGSSGSGKSFASNFMLLQQLARGTKAFVIDIGGSYRKMTKVLGGQYFEINLSGDYGMNPFALKDPSLAPSGERIKSLVNIIELMVADDGEKLSRLNRVQIEEALTKVFETARAKCKSPTLSEFKMFCDASDDPGLKSVGKLLFPWVGRSSFGKLLDRDGTITADSPIVAFDLKGLSQYPDLQSVMILILTNFILNEVENDRTCPKRIILDEAWQFLKSPAASAFMEYAARTFRKTGSGITFITQGVEEINQSGIGSAILNNTSTKLVMLQKADIAVLREALKLNSRELKLIQQLARVKGVYSEGFLMNGESRQVIRIQPTPIEYWISTSEADDNAYIDKLCLSGLSLEEAILKAATDAPSGVAAQLAVAA